MIVAFVISAHLGWSGGPSVTPPGATRERLLKETPRQAVSFAWTAERRRLSSCTETASRRGYFDALCLSTRGTELRPPAIRSG